MDNELTDYFERYVQNPKIILGSEHSTIASADVPEIWREILRAPNVENVIRLIAQPMKYMPETLLNLATALSQTFLLNHDDGFELVFSLNSPSGVLHYSAKNPHTALTTTPVTLLWSKLAPGLRDFYQVFDGFNYLASRSLGLMSSADILPLDQEDWGILDEIETPKFSLPNTLVFFTNGTNGYVCLDTDEGQEATSGILWRSDKAPRCKQSFWGLVDAWTSIGMTQQN
jgi:hypothetical protein